eukprot:Pgem_evm1s2989
MLDKIIKLVLVFVITTTLLINSALGKPNPTSQCETSCHVYAKCIKGKCHCEESYVGDGVKSCK